MKTRTIVEYLETTCPKCGSTYTDGTEYCHSCGTSLIDEYETSDSLNPEVLKKMIKSRKADIVSTVLPIQKKPKDIFSTSSQNIFLALFTLALVVIVFLESSAVGIVSKVALVTLSILLPTGLCTLAIFVLIQDSLEGNWNAYTDVRKKGDLHPAIILGYGQAMHYLDPETGAPDAPALLPTVKVLTKIDDVDLTVVIFLPIGFKPELHPPGSAIDIVSYKRQYLVRLDQQKAYIDWK